MSTIQRLLRCFRRVPAGRGLAATNSAAATGAQSRLASSNVPNSGGSAAPAVHRSPSPTSSTSSHSQTATLLNMAPRFCPTDANSFANTDEIRITHSHLSLAVDFDKRILEGSVTHTAKVVGKSVTEFVLDTSYLDIQQITLLGKEQEEGQTLKFELATRDEKFGSRLTIHFSEAVAAETVVQVCIKYATTDKCTALQWLTPSQTVGKKLPYLFSQCQAIHARSMVPISDTPGVKITYSADITGPANLRVLMSAVRTGEETVGDKKIFRFSQETSIPSYLIALAVGNLASIPIGPRSTVWSEPEVIEAAAWEFAGTEEFIATGESLLTPYDWGIYDLLVLPASFPYGGMENPCLTFVTPTLLAGDRSLVDVVAHEIAHSWFGNLVTTQNWEHFWLNEGFTVFLERKIVGRLQGQPVLEFDAIIGLKALTESVEHYDDIKRPEFTCLCPRLENEDPDEAFSSVPYEKGFNFLFYLEKELGGPAVFEPYLKAHVTKFAHKSINTNDFKTFLYEFYQDQEGKTAILNAVDWEAWFHKPGMPPVTNVFDDSLAKACQQLADEWDAARDQEKPNIDKSSWEQFSSSQKVMFLEKLLQKPSLPHSHLAHFAELYNMPAIQNAEIRFRWQWLCLQAAYTPIFSQVATFLGQVGRMKFVRVLYRALDKCGAEGKEVAKQTFLKNRSFYHPICAAMVAKDLGL
ncbi:leukotriene-A4 hydrolase [Powellomyces hirtus]|uniref:Leukotriene A(4) hydrolase n=1 Tax=Powellomyces hirtus TaxID=109895 RepID=A0A507E3S9_9FUNG|nr:leukotriene-A4 hydrolase [Powellomyces hirtus]